MTPDGQPHKFQCSQEKSQDVDLISSAVKNL